jgi:hypothetical protein
MRSDWKNVDIEKGGIVLSGDCIDRVDRRGPLYLV